MIQMEQIHFIFLSGFTDKTNLFICPEKKTKYDLFLILLVKIVRKQMQMGLLTKNEYFNKNFKFVFTF